MLQKLPFGVPKEILIICYYLKLIECLENYILTEII